jgi:hypothetical protein
MSCRIQLPLAAVLGLHRPPLSSSHLHCQPMMSSSTFNRLHQLPAAGINLRPPSSTSINFPAAKSILRQPSSTSSVLPIRPAASNILQSPSLNIHHPFHFPAALYSTSIIFPDRSAACNIFWPPSSTSFPFVRHPALSSDLVLCLHHPPLCLATCTILLSSASTSIIPSPICPAACTILSQLSSM